MKTKILEVLRLVIVSATFFFGYMIGFNNNIYDPVAQLHFMVPLLIAAIAGLSGLEGLFFAKEAAESKGFETGSNYQRQSAIALLSYAVIAVIVYLADWGIKAELTILFTFMFFIIFSGINHGMDAVRRKNYKWQNINRPFIMLLLVGGLIYPVIKAMQLL